MFLGLDLGTSGLRALLINDTEQPVAAAEHSYSVSHPHNSWSEQDPSDWINAFRSVIADLKGNHPTAFSNLRGIGVSGHMHGATLLDENGQVLRPCILWNDTRSHEEAAILDNDPAFRELSGNIVFPGFTAPKLLWVKKHEPDVFAKVAKVLLPKDYLNYWLTGQYVGDMSDSAGTSWLDVGARGWSSQLLSKSGMSKKQMPGVIEGSGRAGTLRPELAKEWGVSADVAVAGGAGDNAAAACGIGALNDGDAFVSLGTSGVLLVARNSYAPLAEKTVHTFCHAIPERWYQMGVILAATDSLNWLANRLDIPAHELTEQLGTEIHPPGTVRFLPYLSGERTPHNDAHIRGALIGLDISTDNAILTHAVLEGVSFALRDSLEALKSAGSTIDRLLAVGGGSNSDYWLNLLATVLGVPIDLPESGDFGAATGAARLAICAATGASPTDIMKKPTIARTIEPRVDLLEEYDAAYEKYRASYAAIKAIQ